MIVIPTTKGPVLISDEDFTLVMGLSPKWYLDKDGYAVCTVKGKQYKMHKVIGEAHGLKGQIDHQNQQPADNQWRNLREANHRQNQANRGPPSNNTSGFKGVRWCKHANKWQMRIGNGGDCDFAYYETAEEAARAYDRVALKLYGEFAFTNFPRIDYAT